MYTTSNNINRVTKKELYKALGLVSKRGYGKDYKELLYLVEESGVFDNPDFPYDRDSFRTSRVFRGREARILCKALQITNEY